MRTIIDLPRVFLRAAMVDWDIDWRGQSSGDDTGGGDQIVVGGFPRFVGAPALTLPVAMVGHFRAIRATAQGRINAWRVPMIDRVSRQAGGDDWRAQFAAYRRGEYVEPSDKLRCAVAASAGDTSITVDETLLRYPVRVGAFLSYNDWPFIVTSRSGCGAAVVLGVQMLRIAIPVNGQIDLFARGVFLMDDGRAGNPSYAGRQAAQVSLSFSEWITRP
jgi:hypothetical protein